MLFSFAALLSLLFCVATLALWVRSYWSADELYYTTRTTVVGDPSKYWAIPKQRSFRSDTGCIEVVLVNFAGSMDPQYRFPEKEGCFLATGGEPGNLWTSNSPDSGLWRRLHFRFEESLGPLPDGPTTVERVIDVPTWLFPLVAAILPTIWTRQRLRRTAGHCPSRRYNLTGNTSGVCPECGAACKAADPAGVSPAAGN